MTEICLWQIILPIWILGMIFIVDKYGREEGFKNFGNLIGFFLASSLWPVLLVSLFFDYLAEKSKDLDFLLPKRYQKENEEE